jgi:hypothetical protein
MIKVKSFLWKHSIWWFPTIMIVALYFLSGWHYLYCIDFSENIIETTVTINSIIAGFTGSILISLSLENTKAKVLVDNDPLRFKDYKNTFLHSLILSLISTIIGLFTMLKLEFFDTEIYDVQIYKELLLLFWLFIFFASIIKFYDGFSFTVNEIS